MAKTLNTLLCTIAIFLLAYCWVYYCIKDRTLALCLSVIVALAACYLIWRAESKWETSKKKKLAYKKQLANFAEYLRYGENNAKLFEQTLHYYRFETSTIDFDNLIAKRDGKKCYVAIRFVKDSLTKDELCGAVIAAKRQKCDKLYIFTSKADKSLVDAANARIQTVVIDTANTYALFEQCEKLPSVPCKQISKPPFIVAKYALCRKRFGWYFASSLFMLAISLIAYFPWYTLTWATVCFALAAYSLLNRRYNSPPTHVSLD